MFWDNFIFYCAKNNKAPNTVAKELDLSSGSITAWKNGVKPRLTTLSKIADYFDITIEDLTNGEKEKAVSISGNGLSEIQQNMIDWVMNATPEQLQSLYDFLQKTK